MGSADDRKKSFLTGTRRILEPSRISRCILGGGGGSAWHQLKLTAVAARLRCHGSSSWVAAAGVWGLAGAVFLQKQGDPCFGCGCAFFCYVLPHTRSLGVDSMHAAYAAVLHLGIILSRAAVFKSSMGRVRCCRSIQPPMPSAACVTRQVSLCDKGSGSVSTKFGVESVPVSAQ